MTRIYRKCCYFRSIYQRRVIKNIARTNEYFVVLTISVFNRLGKHRCLLIRSSFCVMCHVRLLVEFARATRYTEVCIRKIYSDPGFVSCTHCNCSGRCDIASCYMHIVIRCGILSTMVLALIAPHDQIRTTGK